MYSYKFPYSTLKIHEEDNEKDVLVPSEHFANNLHIPGEMTGGLGTEKKEFPNYFEATQVD